MRQVFFLKNFFFLRFVGFLRVFWVQLGRGPQFAEDYSALKEKLSKRVGNHAEHCSRKSIYICEAFELVSNLHGEFF